MAKSPPSQGGECGFKPRLRHHNHNKEVSIILLRYKTPIQKIQMIPIDDYNINGLNLTVTSGTTDLTFVFKDMLDLGVAVCQMKFDGFTDITNVTYEQL